MLAEVVPIERARERRAGRVHAGEEPRVTGAELQELLKVSDSTLKRWRKAGMPFEPWSARSYRYVLSDVLAWRSRMFA